MNIKWQCQNTQVAKLKQEVVSVGFQDMSLSSQSIFKESMEY